MARLNADQKQELAQLLAERKTWNAIVKYFKDNHGLTVHKGQIKQYKNAPKWQTVIREKREAWDRTLSSEYLASKRNRLRALEEARASAMEPGFAGTTKDGRDIYKNQPAAAVAAVKQAQEEIEGKKLRHEHSGPDGGPIDIRLQSALARKKKLNS